MHLTDITIAYKVLAVYPQSRRVLITCDIPEAPRPITYSLMASRGVLVAKRVVRDYKPATFNINITLKSSPDLLTYSCQAASDLGTYGPSSRLQMYLELWDSEYRGAAGEARGVWIIGGVGEETVDFEMGILEGREEEAAEWTEGRLPASKAEHSPQ